MDSPSIAQQPTNSIGEQFLANGGDPTQAPPVSPSSDSPAPAPATQPTPQNGLQPNAAQAAPAPDPVSAKHQAIGKFFHGLVNSGSGSSSSKFWRTIVGSALAGMAGIGAAEDGPVIHGPYGDVPNRSVLGAAARGIQAGVKMRQDAQDRQLKLAKDQKEEQRRDQESKIQLDDSVLRKHADARAQQTSIQNSVEHEKRMVMLDQTIKNGNWEEAQHTAKSAQDQVAFFNALQDVGAKPLADADGNALRFETHEDAEKAAHDNPKFFIGDFKTRTAYDPSTGKYGIYRVPDTDIKDVKLKDSQGVTHTIPHMTASEYMDYQVRVQNLQKGSLSIQEAQERLKQLREDRKAGSAYSQALAELDKVGGDADKLSPSSRTVLYTTASKNLGDAVRARVSADKAEDTEAQDAALQAIRHYSGVLSRLHGNEPNGANGEGGLNPAQYGQALAHALTLPPDQAVAEINSAKVFSNSDKQRLVKDIGQKRLENVASYMTVLRGPDGKTSNVSNSDVPNWTAKGYTIIGRGAAPPDFSSNEVEKEK